MKRENLLIKYLRFINNYEKENLESIKTNLRSRIKEKEKLVLKFLLMDLSHFL